jgi:predicted component of type VI protein secretion system
VPSLVYRGGPLAGYRHEISLEMSIGRENAALILADGEVSRRHAVIRPVQGGLEVVDLGSTNGTRVNGSRITGPTVIRPGDVLQLGRTEFEVESDPMPGTAQTASARPGAAQGAPASAEPSASFQPPPHRPARRAPATRSTIPLILTLGVIVGTAILLVLYFGLRGSA